jgi:hypothetical protein
MAGNADLVDYYARTHAARVYGTSSVKYLRYLRPEITLLRPASILDYGCGQSVFLDCLNLGYDVELLRYDPAIPAYSKLPENRAGLLVSIDVLEHIEEADLDKVMAEMRASAREALIVIDTVPAKHTLPDGRNAHVSLHPHAWWRERLAGHFEYLEPVKTARRSRAAFRTWPHSGADGLRLHALRARESAAYYAKRLIGRHKRHWKVSSTGKSRSG